jgi:hypothetical protein
MNLNIKVKLFMQHHLLEIDKNIKVKLFMQRHLNDLEMNSKLKRPKMNNFLEKRTKNIIKSKIDKK